MTYANKARVTKKITGLYTCINMDCGVRVFLVIVSCVYISLTTTAGLQCYSCLDLSLDTTDDVLLRTFSSYVTNSTNCGKSVNKDTPGVQVKDCPTGGSPKCYKEVTSAKVSYQTSQFTMKVAMRSCLPIVISSSDSCVTQSVDGETLKTLPFFQTAGITYLSAAGSICTCSTDLCNAQITVAPEKSTWMIALFLAMIWW